MTKKDFELIAGTIARLPAGPAHREVARLFADALAGTNPRFDHAKFLRACGVAGS